MDKTIIIGVAGGTGSGKTTVVNAISAAVAPSALCIINHDNYYRDLSTLSPADRSKVNFDHPDAIETSLLVEHLINLKKGQHVEAPRYDFASHTRMAGRMPIAPCPIIIVEGVLVFAEDALRELFDIKLFVDTDDDIRFIRRLRRDMVERARSMDSVIEQYLATVRPMHIRFVEPSRRYADMIIPEGHNAIAIDMVVSMIRDHVSR